MTYGIIAAVALHMIFAIIIFSKVKREPNEPEEKDQSRLIVIEDMPEPKINLSSVDDPNEPKPQEETTNDTKDPNSVPEIKREPIRRNFVKTPKITRPKDESTISTSDTSTAADRELDSLRKANLTNNTKKDTSKGKTNVTNNTGKGDSLAVSYNENDVGLKLSYPAGWKAIDEREINTNLTKFEGVLLADTTQAKGAVNLFIHLDKEGKDFKQSVYKTEFRMNDSSLSAFSAEPKTQAGKTNYQFYIFNKNSTDKLTINASVNQDLFEKYKPTIESIIRSINFAKPGLP
jgi:outer membrane biosynthesis protein TonB